jgi:hypothetical protein
MSLKERLALKKYSDLGSIRNFEHCNVQYQIPIREDRPGGRVYVTPEGNVYPSATTVIGATGDKSWLDDWKRRIGEKAAHDITSQSARRGTELHAMAERYLLNEKNFLGDNPTPIYFDLFKQVKPRIDESIGKVYAIEAPLYSDKLRVSGTTDCIADWDSIPSIVDWKNARYRKKLADIEGYFVQTNMYARMYSERTGINVEQLVIVMAVEGNQEAALVFKEKTSDWNAKADAVIKEYYDAQI